MEKKKILFLLTLSLILFNSFAIFIINASGLEYNLDINENDIYIWKVETLDEDVYKSVFVGENLGFEEDDYKKVRIDEIDKSTEYWRVFYSYWDYTDDTDDFNNKADDDKSKKVYRDPEEKADNIPLGANEAMDKIADMWLVPTPYTNYIEEFKDEFEHPVVRVDIEDDILIAQISASEEIPATYEMELSYDLNGVLEKLKFIDIKGEEFLEIVLQKEALPGYDVFLIYGLIIICGIISVIIWQKKIHINDG
ncbi:MAG: hypothetical protein ACFFAH_03920 [Promethearchaeota archaeon]